MTSSREADTDDWCCLPETSACLFQAHVGNHVKQRYWRYAEGIAVMV